MKRKRALHVIAFITAFIGIGLLFLFPLREFVRMTFLEPLITVYYFIRWYTLRFPQIFLWSMIFLIAAFVLLQRYLRELGPSSQHRIKKRKAPPLLSEPAQLAMLIGRTHRHPFARRSLAAGLVQLTVRMIARREGISLSEAREKFASFDWCDDPAVEEFFHYRSPSHRWGRGGDFHKKMQQTISFLERYYQGV